MECPNCHAAVDDDARFCSTCGNEMTRRHDERRLVTVLFADIVGFTGLSEARDPEQVKNLVDRCFALLADDITAFGGRVDKVIGDAIVALFGAPVAHEDDAERAVRAALRMQETVGRFDAEAGVGIQVRIGVNTGEVLVGAIAAGDDYTAMGDVVNTASRLQTAADPGWVLVGAATHGATDETIHYRSVGRLHARGREEPLEAYRAVEPVGVPGERRSGPSTPLIGREPEAEMLGAAIAAAFGRKRAQLLTLTGESGVGKTRLAQEVADFARERHDAVVLHGRCLPYGEANLWWPIAEAIRDVIGIDAQADVEEAGPLVHDAVVTALGPEAEDSNIERTAEGLRHLLGFDTGLTRVDGERAADEGTRAARALAYGLTRRSPVLLWLSDLDWADDAVMRLLDDLLDRLGRSPLVVMVTAQGEVLDRWRPRPGRFNSLTLSIEPLSNADGDRLARELLPDVDPSVRRELVERSGGNPLFLEEMARMLANAEGEEIGPLPANVRSVISSRLDSLDEAARHVIEDASVLGIRGEVMALERMAELQRDVSDVGEQLRQLERVDLIEADGKNWSFRSNLVRDVVYARLTKTDRAWRHSGIAGWLEANKGFANVDTISYHYRRAATLASELGGVAGMPDDLIENAVRATIDAGKAVSATAPGRAEHLFGEALDLMGEGDPRRVEVLIERAASALSRLDTTLARVDLAAAAPLLPAAEDPRMKVRHTLLESELAQWSGEQDLALAQADEALVMAMKLGDGRLEGDALRQSGMVRLFRREHELAETSINASFDAYKAVDDIGGMAWARQNLAWISYVQGRMGEAEGRLDDAVEIFDRIGDLSGIAWSRGLLAYVRIHSGRFAEAEEIARQTLAEARDRGDKWAQGMMHVALANAALWTGRIDEAITRATKARTTFPFGSDPIGPAQATAVLGRALVRSGRPAEGFRLFHSSIEDDTDNPMVEMIESSLAAAAATVGDIAQGRRVIAHDVTGIDPDRIGESDLAVATSLIRLQMGEPEAAATLFDVMPGTEQDAGSVWGWAVLALVASAVGKDAAPFVALVEDSTRATYADHVLARCAAACAAARAGDEEAARLALDRAYEAIPLGGDRIHPTVVALAEAQCLVALHTDDAAAAEVRAIKTAGALGIDTLGWRTAFAAACGDLEPVE